MIINQHDILENNSRKDDENRTSKHTLTKQLDITKLLLSCYLLQLSNNSKIHFHNLAITFEIKRVVIETTGVCDVTTSRLLGMAMTS